RSRAASRTRTRRARSRRSGDAGTIGALQPSRGRAMADVDVTDPEILPLADAVVRWSDPSLVEAVRAQERRFLPYHLHEFYLVSTEFRMKLTPDCGLMQTARTGCRAGPPDFRSLTTAWRALERVFRARLVRGDLHLLGVRMKPTRETE